MRPLIVPCSYGRVVLVELGGSIIRHVHPNAQILVKVAGPPRNVTIDDETHVLRDETAIVLAPLQPHGGYADDDSAPTRALLFHIEPAQDGHHPPIACSGSHTLSKPMRAALDRFHVELTRGTASKDEADSVIELLLDSYCADERDEPPVRFIDHRIRRAIRHIQVDPSLGNNLSDCAEIAGLSRPHFFYLFRHTVGINPRLFCNSIRLTMAVNSLLDGSLPIRSISSQLGFSAPSHFTRFFLRHIGVPPRRFREGALADGTYTVRATAVA